MTLDARVLPHAFALERYSPTSFDPTRDVSGDEVDVLLEAAGRAPSAGNSQPWSFIVGRRGDAIHQRLVTHLAPSTATWAPQAGLLIANLAHRLVEGSDFEFSEFAHYDLGQAVAHLTFQAHTLGLSVHQFRAFDRDGLQREFDVPAHWQVTTMAAVGVAGDGAAPVRSAGTSRERHPVERITWVRA